MTALARRHRLSGRRVFEALRKHGARRSGRLVAVTSQTHGTRPPAAAVVMGTKVAKSAVVRNRHKRVIRDILRTRLPTWPVGRQVAVFVRRAATTPADWDALREEVRTLLAP